MTTQPATPPNALSRAPSGPPFPIPHLAGAAEPNTEGHLLMPVIEAPALGAYRLEPNESTIEFTTRHLFGLAPVRGTFALREGVVHVADPIDASLVRATIEARSFDTGLPARDRTVCSPQYLDTAHHPDITFVANGVDQNEALQGTLTVRGRTEPLKVHITEVRVLGNRLQLRANAEVDRYRWGITAMKGMTGRHLRFKLSMVATRLDDHR